MATLISNSFSSYEMTEEEQLQAALLTLQQVQNIKSQIAILAEQKINLVPDSQDFVNYMQEEANLRGQITSLQYLLDCSEAANTALNDHTPQ